MPSFLALTLATFAGLAALGAADADAAPTLVLVEGANNSVSAILGLSDATELAYDLCGAKPAGEAGLVVPTQLGAGSLYVAGELVASVEVREAPVVSPLRYLSAADVQVSGVGADDDFALAEDGRASFKPAGGVWTPLETVVEIVALPTVNQTLAFPGGGIVLPGAVAGDWVYPGAGEPSQLTEDGVWAAPLQLFGKLSLSYATHGTTIYEPIGAVTALAVAVSPAAVLFGTDVELQVDGVDFGVYESGFVETGAPCSGRDMAVSEAGEHDLCLRLLQGGSWLTVAGAVEVLVPDAPSPPVATVGVETAFALSVGAFAALATDCDAVEGNGTAVVDGEAPLTPPADDGDAVELCVSLGHGFVSAGSVALVDPPTFSPARVFAGEVNFAVSDALPGTSFVAWVHSTSGVCDDSIALDNESPTAVHSLTYVKIDAGAETFRLHGTAAAGDWQLCYRPGWDGQWTAIPGALLTVDEAPVALGGLTASRGAEQTVYFRGGLEGDYVAFVSGGDGCYGASEADASAVVEDTTTEVEGNATLVTTTTVTTTVWYYPPAWLTKFSGDGVAVTPSDFMSELGAYSICVATAESLADDDYDFVEAGALSLSRSGTFYPTHTFVGAPRLMATGFSAGDVLVFTTAGNCGAISDTTELAHNHTAAAVVADPALFEAALPVDAQEGQWRLCRRAEGDNEFSTYGDDRVTIEALPELNATSSLQLVAGCPSRFSLVGSDRHEELLIRVNGLVSDHEFVTVNVSGVFAVFVAVLEAPADWILLPSQTVEVLDPPVVEPLRVANLAQLNATADIAYSSSLFDLPPHHGSWTVWFKPTLGAWTELVVHDPVEYLEQPEFFPLRVLAGTSVELTFSAPAQAGDVVNGVALGEDLVAQLEATDVDLEIYWQGFPLDVALQVAVTPAGVRSEYAFAGTTATLALDTYDSAEDEVFYTATGDCGRPATLLATPTTAKNHETVQPGTLQLCYRPVDGVWTLVAGVSVTVIGELQWGPFEVTASSSTPVSVWSAAYGLSFELWVFVQTRGCDSYRILEPTLINSNSSFELDVSGVPAGDNVLAVYMSATRTSGSWFRAGFLSVAAQVTVSASVAYQGSETPIQFGGLANGDAVGWTYSTSNDCAGGREAFVDVLPADLVAGTTLQLCHRLGAVGAWALVHGLTVEVQEQPAVFPTTVFAASALNFSLSSAVLKTADLCDAEEVIDPTEIASLALYLGDAKLVTTIEVIEPPTLTYRHLYTEITTTTYSHAEYAYVAWTTTDSCADDADRVEDPTEAGEWTMCAKPVANGAWTTLTTETIVLDALPAVVASASVFDSGSWELPVSGLREGDVVAVSSSADSCDNATVLDGSLTLSDIGFGVTELYVCVAADTGLAPFVELAQSIVVAASTTAPLYSFDDPTCARSTLLMAASASSASPGNWTACAGEGQPVPGGSVEVPGLDDATAEYLYPHELAEYSWPEHFPVPVYPPADVNATVGDWLIVGCDNTTATFAAINDEGFAWIDGSRPTGPLLLCHAPADDFFSSRVVVGEVEQTSSGTTLVRTLHGANATGRFAASAYACLDAAQEPPLAAGVWFECLGDAAHALLDVVALPTVTSSAWILAGVENVVELDGAVDGDLVGGSAVLDGSVVLTPSSGAAEAIEYTLAAGEDSLPVAGLQVAEISLSVTRAVATATAEDVGLNVTAGTSAELEADGSITWEGAVTAAESVELVDFDLEFYSVVANVTSTVAVTGGAAADGDLLWLMVEDAEPFVIADGGIVVDFAEGNGTYELCLATAELPAVFGACHSFEFVAVPAVYPQQTFVGGNPSVPEGMTWRWNDGGACGQTLNTEIEGSWTACYRVSSEAEWSTVSWIGMEVLPLPVPNPRVAISGHNTSVSLAGLESGASVGGGYIGCGGFYFAYGRLSMAVTTVQSQGILLSSAVYGVGYMAVWLAVPGSVEDFVELPAENQVQMVAAVEVSPRRTLEGAQQLLAMENGAWGWVITWVGSSGVNVTTAPAATFLFTAPAGVYECYQTPLDGVETRVPECDIVVAPAPVFSPVSAVAGIEVSLQFADGAAVGDVVFAAADCTDPEHALTSKASLGKRELDDGMQIRTSTLLSRAVVMQMCVAASPGDSADDYVSVGEFELVDPPEWGPQRTVSTAVQVLRLANPRVGDELFFSADANCSSTASSATTEAIAVEEVPFEMQLTGTLDAGDWTMCYRVAGDSSVWQELGEPLSIVEPPTFVYPVVVAGSYTPMTFADGAAEHDLVRMSYGNCSSPAYSGSLGSNLRLWTPRWLDEVAPRAICFATGESGGDEDSDFVQLGAADAVAPPSISLRRTFYSAPQEMCVNGTNSTRGDAVGFNLNGRCWQQPADAELLETGCTTMPTDADEGRWALCFRPTPDGYWTDVYDVDLQVLSLPTIPVFGVAYVPLEYPIEGAEPGDLVGLVRKGEECRATSVVSDALTFNTTAESWAHGEWKVCVATAGGGAFAELPEPFLLLNDTTFAPAVVFEGASAVVYVATTEDNFGFGRDGANCEFAFSATGRRTTTITLDPFMPAGEYMFCSPSTGAVRSDRNLTVLEAPLVQPCRAFAGTETELWLAAPAEDSDWVAVVASTSCSGAAAAAQVVLNNTVTIAATSSVRTFTVCLATAESAGDEDSDYSVIPTTFETVREPTVAPSRVAFHSGELDLFLSGAHNGDHYYFTSSGYCEGRNDSFLFSELDHHHEHLEVGTWTLCMQPCGAGPWFTISDATVEVVEPPSAVEPVCGVATLGRSFEVLGGDTADGDFVALVPWGSNCSATSPALTTLPSLVTPPEMDTAGPYLACFATLESGSGYFVPLAGNITMRRRVDIVSELRTFVEAPLATLDGLVGAQSEVGVSLDEACSVVSAFSSRPTLELLDTDYHLCQRAVDCDGTWQLSVQSIQRWPTPEFSPAVGFAGHAVTVEFDSNAVVGDRWATLDSANANCSEVESWSTFDDSTVEMEFATAGTRTVCVTTGLDWAPAGTFEVIDAPELGVMVTVEGSGQLVAPTNKQGVSFSWTCTDDDAFSAEELSVPVATEAGALLWLCAKANRGGGVWTSIAGQSVAVVAVPEYWPTVGLEGLPTAIDVARDDGFVTLDPACDPAAAVPIAELAVASADVTTMCYATAESGGDSADDFVPMTPDYDQYTVTLLPTRICLGAPDGVRVQGGRTGDNSTLETGVTGEHTLAYQPPNGRWTPVPAAVVAVEALPTLSPSVLVTGAARAVTVSGAGVREGDVVIVGGASYVVGAEGQVVVAEPAEVVAFATAEMAAASDEPCALPLESFSLRDPVTVSLLGCGHTAIVCGLQAGDEVRIDSAALLASASGCERLRIGFGEAGSFPVLFTPVGDSQLTELASVELPSRSDVVGGIVTVLEAPLANVAVTLWAADGVALNTTYTNGDGRYAFGDLPSLSSCDELFAAANRSSGLLSSSIGEFLLGGDAHGSGDITFELELDGLEEELGAAIEAVFGPDAGGDCHGACHWAPLAKAAVENGLAFELPASFSATWPSWQTGEWGNTRAALSRLQGEDALAAELLAAELFIHNYGALPSPWGDLQIAYMDLVRAAPAPEMLGVLRALNGLAFSLTMS